MTRRQSGPTPIHVREASVFCRASDCVGASMEQYFWRWACLLIVLLLMASIANDIRLKLWLDELLTVHMSQQGGPAAIVKATIDGSDGAPPLYAMIVAAISGTVRNQALAVRLPSTLAFCAMVGCLLAFCRRRLTAIYSYVAVLFAIASCMPYSTEGRGYGMVLGTAAAALLCWQMAVERRRRYLNLVLLTLCLAFMTSLHYYSIFFLVPLLIAEVVRWQKSGKLDSAILFAMVPAVLVLFVHYPLIHAWKPILVHRCLPVEWSHILQFYLQYCLPVWPAFICAVAALGAFTDPRSGTALTSERKAGFLIHELVAIIGLALMPPIMIAIAKYTTHLFPHRYAIWAVIGISLLFACMLSIAAGQEKAVAVMVLTTLVVLVVAKEAILLIKAPVLQQGEAIRRQIERLPESSTAVVVANASSFVELSYYEEPSVRDRLIYPVSRDLELRYKHCDTLSLLMLALSRHTNLRIAEYNVVLSNHQTFVLAATPDDYLPLQLLKEGYQLDAIYKENPPLLFMVKAPGR